MIEFPSTPTIGDLVTEGNKIWECVSAGPPAIWDLQSTPDDIANEAYESQVAAAASAAAASVTATQAADLVTEAAAYIGGHEVSPTAHPATSVVNTPAGSIVATTVQAAINELDTEKAAASALAGTGGAALIGDVLGTVQDTLRAIEGTVQGLATIRADNIPLTDTATIVAGPDTTNLADSEVTDAALANTAAQLHRLYNTGGALSAASSTSLGTFAVTRKYYVTEGVEYTVSIHGAPLNAVFYFTGSPFIGFYNTDGSFHSQITSGFTSASGNRSVTFTVPAGAERVAFNLRDANNFSNTAPMTEGYLQSVLDRVMLNTGSTALPFVEYSDGTFAPTSDLFDPENDDELIVIKQDEYYYVRAAAQVSDDSDVVWRLRVNHPLNYYRVDSRSGVLDFYGIRFIDSDTSADGTVAAFNQSTQVHNAGMDESCPIKLNSMYVAGGHGVIGYKATAAAHGKTNVDVGSLWTDGTIQWVLYFIDATGSLTFVRRYTGTSSKWTISSSGFTFGSSGTLTHVSGATNTGSVTVTAAAQQQVVPIARDYLAEFRVDDTAISANGLYRGTDVAVREIYSLMNIALQQDYLIANVGAADPDYDNAAILAQTRLFHEYAWNRWGAMSSRCGEGVKIAYRRGAGIDYWGGGIQLQRPSLTGDTPAGMHTRIDLFVPDIASVGGTDYKAIANVTANASEVRFPRASCEDPTDPASHFCFLGKDGSGNVLSGHLFGFSRLTGLGVPAERAVSVTEVAIMSSAEKLYPFAIDSAVGDSVAADVNTIDGFRAPFLPTDTDLTIPGVVVTVGGVHLIYITAHQTLTQKEVALPSALNGRPISVLKSHANVTVHSVYIADSKVLVSVAGGYGDVILQVQ
jgi:hypothetical protein